jgi:sarcosine oxidase subunit beta
MRFTADVVVIGAGVIGSSIALELTRAGRDVVVVDKAGGIGHGSTSASSAIIRFNYSTWSGVALAWESLHCWTSWAEHLGYDDPDGLARFERTGMLLLNGGDSCGTTALFDRAGIPWESWDAAEIGRRLPHLDPGAYGPPKPVDSDAFYDDANGTVSGLFTPDAGFVNDPQLAAHNLGTAAQALGARFLLHRLVRAISAGTDHRWTVELDDASSVTAPVVVNAAGPWSGKVNELAGVGADFRVTTRPLRQEVHHVPAPEGFNAPASLGVSIADLDLGTYLRASPGDGLLVGGTEPECDPLEWIDDPDASNVHATVPRFTAQVTRAARRMPGLEIPHRPRGVAGVYDAASDWTPIYDRTSAPGFYVAMGTSGNQFKNAPVVGQLMTALIDAVESGRDHDAEPVVHVGPRTGRAIDLGTFSRLREVGDGPTSVMG